MIRAPEPKYAVGDTVFHHAGGGPFIVKERWLEVPTPGGTCDECGQALPAQESVWCYSFQEMPGVLPEDCLVSEPVDRQSRELRIGREAMIMDLRRDVVLAASTDKLVSIEHNIEVEEPPRTPALRTHHIRIVEEI